MAAMKVSTRKKADNELIFLLVDSLQVYFDDTFTLLSYPLLEN